MFVTIKRTLTRRIPSRHRPGNRETPATRSLATIIPTATASLLVVAAVSGSTPGGAAENNATVTPLAPSFEMALEDLLAQTCYPCEPCDGFGHRILDSRPPPNDGRLAFHPHPCITRTGSCDPEDGPHPPCGGTEAFASGFSDVIQTLKASTSEQLTALVAGSPHRLRINRSRQALQLIGCQDRVVASYSVNSIPALEALLS